MRWIEQFKQFKLNAKRRKQGEKFSADAKRYLESVLGPKFSVSMFEPISDLYKRKVYRGVDENGKAVSIKLYRGKEIRLAERLIELQPLLEQSGIMIPKLIGSDLSDETENEFSLGAIVSEWIEGTHWTAGDLDSSAKAMNLLSQLHRVDHGRFDAARDLLNRSHPVDFQSAGLIASNLIEMIDRVHFEIGPIDRKKVSDLFRKEFESTRDRGSDSPRLIHLDFSLRNLLLTGAGEVCMLDFEECTLGSPSLDLALAILNLGFGFGSASLDEVLPNEIIETEIWKKLEGAYYESAPAEEFELWKNHRWSCLVWAYVWMIANVAKKSVNPHRYSPEERKRYGRWVKRHWQRLSGVS